MMMCWNSWKGSRQSLPSHTRTKRGRFFCTPRRLLSAVIAAVLLYILIRKGLTLRRRAKRRAEAAARDAAENMCLDPCSRGDIELLGCTDLRGHGLPLDRPCGIPAAIEGIKHANEQWEGGTSRLPVPCIVHYMGPDEPWTHNFTASWDTCMPEGCRSRFWTDDDLRAFVSDKYSALMDFYSGMEIPILQWDFVRYLILHTYGGIYRDSDYECTAPPGQFTLGSDDLPLHVVESRWKFNEWVQNSLMASVPGHPFWMDLANDVVRTGLKGWCRQHNGRIDVLASTGPQRLEKWIAMPEYVSCVNVLPWRRYFGEAEKGRGDMAHHHGAVSWGPQMQLETYNLSCGCTDEACKVRGHICKERP